jgi:hypothetical protein
MTRGRIWILLFVLCCAALFPLPSQSHMDSSQRINGTFYAISSGRSAGRSRSGQFSLIVNRYTAANELRELNEALQGGQDDLLKALSRMDAGRVQIGTGVGVPANAIIRDTWGDGGTKLTVFYERYIRFFELRYGTRSQDYPIGYAEIFLDRNGRGEGTLIPAAKVRLRGGNTWEVEDFGVLPARLMGLRASGTVETR